MYNLHELYIRIARANVKRFFDMQICDRFDEFNLHSGSKIYQIFYKCKWLVYVCITEQERSGLIIAPPPNASSTSLPGKIVQINLNKSKKGFYKQTLVRYLFEGMTNFSFIFGSFTPSYIYITTLDAYMHVMTLFDIGLFV